MPAPRFVEVVHAVWWESAPMRAVLHRVGRDSICDVRVLADGRDIAGVRPEPNDRPMTPRLHISGECACAHYLMDMLAEADRFLAAYGRTLRNPPGAVRQHLRTRAADWTRRRRTEMGAQARTDRIRSTVRARSLPDDFHRALLEYLVGEAGSLAPLEDDAQLHRRLCELAAAEFDGVAADYRDRVTEAMRVVELVCRSGRLVPEGPGQTGRITWWERYVDRPLGRRRRLGDESLSAGPPAGGGLDRTQIACPSAEREFDRLLGTGGPVDVDVDPDRDVLVLTVVLDAAVEALARPDADLARAVESATADLVRRRALPSGVAAGFVADRHRVQEAIQQILVITKTAA